MNNVVYGINSHPILGEWKEFMSAVGASPSTIKVRVHTIGALTRHAGLDDPLKLTRHDALSYLARPRKQWSRVTYWRCIKAWCVWLDEFDYEHNDLLKGVPKPRIPSAVARPIDKETVTALLASNMTRKTRAYVMLALFQALRVHEIAKIRGEDFDFNAGWLTVTGKGNVTKPVPIHSEIAKLAAEWPEVGYWFPSSIDIGGHVTPLAVSTTVGNAFRAVGSKGTAHRLRDTAASELQRQSHDLMLTKALLRHSSVTSTTKYIDVSNTALQDAVRAVDWGTAA